MTSSTSAAGETIVRKNLPGSIVGIAYSYLDDAFVSGVLTSITFYDASGNIVATKVFQQNGGYEITVAGALVRLKTVNADGSYNLQVNSSGTFLGFNYAYFVNAYTALGFRDLITFYDVSGQAVGSKSFESNGSFSITLNGALYKTVTYGAGGSHDVHPYVAGTLYGVSYDSYDVTYDSSGARTLITFFNESGQTVGTKTFSADGGYAVTLNGSLYLQKTFNADGSFDIIANAPGVFYGVAFASFDRRYNASGVIESAVFEDSGGNPVATETAGVNGDSVALNVTPNVPLGAAEIAAISSTDTALWSTVTAAWLDGLAGDAVAALTAADLAAIPAATYSGVNAGFIANIASGAIVGLSASKIAALSPAAFAALPGAAVAALDFQTLPNGVVAELTPAQIADLTQAQLMVLSAGQWAAFSDAQLAAFPASDAQFIQIQDVSDSAISGWSVADIEAAPGLAASLSAAETAALSVQQIGALVASDPNLVNELSPGDIGALSGGAFANLGAANLLKLDAAQLAALTEDQVNALAAADPAGFWQNVPARWINGLSSFSLAGLDPILAELQPATIAGLSPSAFGQLAADAWSFFTPAQTAAVTADQAQVGLAQPGFDFASIRYPWDLNVAVIASLSPASVSAFPASDFSSLDAQWLNNLPLPDLRVLSAAQLGAILPQYIPYLNTSIFAVLSASQIGGLTAAQIEAFTAADFLALANSAPQDLPDVDLANLNASQLIGVDVVSEFTPSQIAASPALQAAEERSWTTAQIESVGITNLTATEIQALSADQLVDLPQADIEAFSTEQLLEMNPQQLAAIVNFLPYTTTLEFEVSAITGTPTQLADDFQGWTATSYGPGTLGDPALWPHFTAQQVAAISGEIENILFTASAANLSGQQAPNGEQALTLFDDLLTLPDSAFAGLVEGRSGYTALLGLLQESFLISKPLTPSEIDSIAPSQWFTALQFEESQGGGFANAAAFFDDNASRAAIYGYEISQDLGRFEAWTNSHALNSLTDDQLAVLNPPAAQTLSLSQIESLSSTQFDAIYPNLDTAQAEGLLFDEVKALPVSAQGQFYNGADLNSDLQALLDPGATPNQLFSSAFTTADQIDGQNFIDIYDQNYPQISADPAAFEVFTNFYNLLETRSNTLISDATIASQITSEVNAILLGFTQYNTALVQNPPDPANNTNLEDYLGQVASQLTGLGGGLTSLESDLGALSEIVQNVLGLVLDNKTEATPLAAYTQWALDGSPNAVTPPGQGVLTYDGQSGLTFQQALEQVEYALFTNADDFVSNALSNVAQVAQAQRAQQQQMMLDDVLNIVEAVASLGAGVGGLISAFSETFGATVDLEGQLNKVVNTLGAVDYEVSSGQSLAESFGATGSDDDHTSFSAAGGEIGTVVNAITSDLTSNDSYAQAAIHEADLFAANYQKLISTIAASIGSPVTLGEQNVDSGDPNYSASLYDDVANTGTTVVGNDPTSIYRLSTVRDMPVQDVIDFTGADGHTYNVNLDLAHIFGPNPNQFDDDVLLVSRGLYHGNIFEAYETYSAPGPNIFGYASTAVQIEIVQNDPHSPSGGNGNWDLVDVKLIGSNPKT